MNDFAFLSSCQLSLPRLRPSQRLWRPKRLCSKVYTAKGRRKSGLLLPSVALKLCVSVGSPSIPARVLHEETSKPLTLITKLKNVCEWWFNAIKVWNIFWFQHIELMHLYTSLSGSCQFMWCLIACILYQVGPLCHHQVPLDNRVRHEEDWRQQHTCVYCGRQGKQTPDQTRC